MENKKLEKMVEGLDCSVLFCRNDADVTIVYASDKFYRMLGYEKGEITALLGRGPDSVLRNETPVNWAAVSAEIREKGYARPELRLIRKNGHHLWAAYRVTMEVRDGCEVFCGLLYDITLQRRSQRMVREQAEELEALTANVPGGVLRFCDDEFLTLDLISEGFCRITGFSREEIAEKFQNRFLNMVNEKDRGLLMRRVGPKIRRSVLAEVTYRIAAKDRPFLWVLDKVRRRADCNGNVWLYSVLIDITETKRAQDELAVSEERYRMILEHAADPVLDFDIKRGLFYYSPAFLSKFGSAFPDSGNLEQLLKKSDFIYGPDRERVVRRWFALMSGENEPDEEYRFRCSDGSYIWCNVHTAAFFDPQSTATRLIAVISDIDKRKKETLILRQKAEHDLLTGLYNRVTTTAMVEDAIAQSRRGDRHALFVIDIDNFKHVNDNLGHLCGDQLIVQIAAQIKNQFREEDILGRIGGDEFVVFLKNIISLDIILKKAEILRKIFFDMRESSILKCKVTGSVGISIFPYDGRSYEELFRKADTAMYSAKKNGKDSCRVYTREIDTVLCECGELL